MDEKNSILCACGKPLHYTDPVHEELVRSFVARFGEKIKVTVNGRSFMVPRHFIALHGLRASEILQIAARYGFEEIQGI